MKGYVIEVTDADGYKHYPLEGADGIGKTTIERSDSSLMYRGYQIVYPKKADAEAQLNRIRILAEAKAENSGMPDKPVMPIEVAVVRYKQYRAPYRSQWEKDKNI